MMTPEQQTKWDRVIARARKNEVWSDDDAILAAGAELKELRKEVRYLRHYGNKDAVHMAEDAMRNDELDDGPDPLQGRFTLQAEGKHPAPCARHCEANAFEIEIRTLKRELSELLEALKEMTHLFDIHDDCESVNHTFECRQRARAAIASMEGEQV